MRKKLTRKGVAKINFKLRQTILKKLPNYSKKLLWLTRDKLNWREYLDMLPARIVRQEFVDKCAFVGPDFFLKIQPRSNLARNDKQIFTQLKKDDMINMIIFIDEPISWRQILSEPDYLFGEKESKDLETDTEIILAPVFLKHTIKVNLISRQKSLDDYFKQLPEPFRIGYMNKNFYFDRWYKQPFEVNLTEFQKNKLKARGINLEDMLDQLVVV